MTSQPTGRAALEAFEAQPRMEPGTWGFWEVWGATPLSLRPGDIVIVKVRDTEEVQVDYVAELTGNTMARVNYVNQDGARYSIGMLAPVVVVRWGQHATLCERVR